MSNKVAIFADTHNGARDDNDFYIRHQSHFFGKIFFPTLEKMQVSKVFHLGDLFDKRRAINVKSLRHLNQSLITPLIQGGYDYYQLLGNHDIYYKNTRKVSAISEIYGPCVSPTFHIISEPQTVDINGVPVFLMPWIVPDEEETLATSLHTTNAKICFGHFELSGFQMLKNVMAKTGMDSGMLNHFDIVMSGHYHTGSLDKNIMYVGAPFQMTYADAADKKRFVILDLDTYEMQVVYNTDHVFAIIQYADGFDVDNYDYDKLHDINVKVIVLEKGDTKAFDTFYKRVQAAKPFTVTLIDKYVFQTTATDATEDVQIEKDTLTVLMESATTMGVHHDRIVPVQNILQKLFLRATAE